MKNVSFLLFCFFLSTISNSQSNKKSESCKTFVYNLTLDKMSVRNICFTVELTNHIDMNKFRVGQNWDKQHDFWKYSITISDNDKLKKQNIQASFFIYEDNSEYVQYHCNVDSLEILALIYNKTNDKWQLLFFQNEEYKMLSSYSGYHFRNAFDIKAKKIGDGGY